MLAYYRVMTPVTDDTELGMIRICGVLRESTPHEHVGNPIIGKLPVGDCEEETVAAGARGNPDEPRREADRYIIVSVFGKQSVD